MLRVNAVCPVHSCSTGTSFDSEEAIKENVVRAFVKARDLLQDL
jgi:hypothetical protein